MRSRTTPLVLASVGARGAPAGVVVRLGGPRSEGETVSGLVRRLGEGPATGRREAATALGQVVGPGANASARGLIAAMDDGDAEVRARSARALGALLGANPLTTVVDEAIKVLTSALGDKDARVRAASAVALRGLGRDPPGSLDALLDGLRGDDPALGLATAEALAARPIRDADDLRRLLDALDDADEAVRRSARSALARPRRDLSPATALSVLGATIRGGIARGPRGRGDPARPLARPGPRRARPAARCAREGCRPDGPGRGGGGPGGVLRGGPGAGGAAGIDGRPGPSRPRHRLGEPGRRPPLGEGRGDRRAPRRAGRRRLAARGRRRGRGRPRPRLRRLVEALRDPSPRVRAPRRRSRLGEVADRSPDPPTAIAALAGALADPDPSVRRAAASALARFGAAARPALDALKQAVRDADRGVSAAALVTLQGLDRPVQVR